MIDVIRQFKEKTIEVNVYFSHLEDLLMNDGYVISKEGKNQKISNELAQILRANSFLLLYNLIESCISQAVEEIHSDIVRNEIEYNTVKITIRKEIMKFIRKDVSTDIFVQDVKNIITDVLKYYPTSRKMFSGNVDAKEIRNVAERYGFSSETNKSQTKDGYNLLTVKEKRNDLAHGFISFQECGKGYTIQEIINIKNEVIFYLEQILSNIQIYINNKDYIQRDS